MPERWISSKNQEPLPSFESCRSRLKLAERTIKNRLAKENGSTSRALTALVSSTGSQQHLESSVNSSRSTTKPNKPKKSNSKASGKGRSFGSNQQQSGPSNGMPWQPQQGPFSWPSWN
uniref:Uncharacterized protein n=1 Tax=Chenopodium quinoa TaxID=63459 RepID=A0A803NF66_CHEQI